MSTTNPYYTRWLAGVVIAAGLGTAIITGGTVASADTGAAATNSSAPASPTTEPVDDGVSGRKLQEEVGVPKNPVKSNVPPTRTTDNIQKLLDDIHGMNPNL